MENGSNKLFCVEVLVLETKREKYFPILFQHRCLARVGINNNLNDEKKSHVEEMQMTTVQIKITKSDLSVWT